MATEKSETESWQDALLAHLQKQSETIESLLTEVKGLRADLAKQAEITQRLQLANHTATVNSAKVSPKPTLKSGKEEKGEEKVKSSLANFDDGTLRVIEDYSDKAIVLHGETACRELKDAVLKPMEFKFGYNFAYGPGWMSRKDKVEPLLAAIEKENKMRLKKGKKKISVTIVSRQDMQELEQETGSTKAAELLDEVPVTKTIKKKVIEEEASVDEDEQENNEEEEEEAKPVKVVKRVLGRKPK